MASAAKPDQGPIDTDPLLRALVALAGLGLVALPSALAAASFSLSDGFLDEEPLVLIKIRSFAMQTQPALADGLRSASQAMAALLAAYWFRRGGRLSLLGWTALGWLVASAALGLWIGTELATVSPGNIDGGAESLRVLRSFGQATVQSAFTYLALLVGLRPRGVR